MRFMIHRNKSQIKMGKMGAVHKEPQSMQQTPDGTFSDTFISDSRHACEDGTHSRKAKT
jgi:hypothetical protein